jgi:hypothetical protein
MGSTTHCLGLGVHAVQIILPYVTGYADRLDRLPCGRRKFWLWAFRSAENDVLVIIIDSRGKDVAKDTLGENFHSPVIVEGWKAYSYLRIIQRCWTHLIREVDAFKSSVKGMELSGEIHEMFRELKEYMKSENMDGRKSMKVLFGKRMEDIVRRYDTYRELHKPVAYIRKGSVHNSPACSIPEWNHRAILLNRK